MGFDRGSSRRGSADQVGANARSTAAPALTLTLPRRGAVILSRRSRNTPIPHDPVLYRARNRIERCFSKLKHVRRMATRYDRCDSHFLSFIHLASALL